MMHRNEIAMVNANFDRVVQERDEWKARAERAIADVSRLLRERDEEIARAERAERIVEAVKKLCDETTDTFADEYEAEHLGVYVKALRRVIAKST